MSKSRMRVVDSTIQRELSTIFAREVFPSFEGILITITDVHTTADLRQCTVYISILGGKASHREDVIKFLERRKEDFFQHIRKRVSMKFIPQIRWFLDDTPEQADRISRLIDSLDP